jgi:hypothetical protein
MTETIKKLNHFNDSSMDRFPVQPVIARLKASHDPKEILVEWDGFEPKPARLLSSVNRSELLKNAAYGHEVLVMFVQGNPDEPVILGVMDNGLEEYEIMQDGPVDVLIDGERVVIRAETEMVFTCGEGSIILQKDGKIEVKGKNVLSRAYGVNKIKGGHVQLN